jgi:hypothetical protein
VKFTWLSAGEIPADCLADLRTDQCTLSLWEVDEAKSRVMDVACGVVAGGMKIAHFDYALFPIDQLNQFGALDKVGGATPLEDINAWHWDLGQLSAQRVLQFAVFLSGNAQFHRIPKADIRQRLRELLRADKMKLESLSDGVRDEILGVNGG